MPTFSKNWTHSANRDEWWQWLEEHYAGKPDLRYLEVGVFEGRSALLMLDRVLTEENCCALLVDSLVLAERYRQTPQKLQSQLAENLKPHHNRYFLWTYPFVDFAIKYWDSLMSDPLDLIYIDGNHTAHDVLQDSVLAWHMLKVGGVMWWDDANMKQVLHAIRAFVGCQPPDTYEEIYLREIYAIRKTGVLSEIRG